MVLFAKQHAGGFWWVLVGTGGYWWVLADSRPAELVNLAGTRGYWWGTGGCWRVQSDTGG